MKLKSIKVSCLKLPFVHTFAHSLKKRNYSDSIIVKLKTENGVTGYGEGIAREYVTGETVSASVGFIMAHIWPSIEGLDFSTLNDFVKAKDLFPFLEEIIPEGPLDFGVIAWNAARSAVEIAMIDCWLRLNNRNISDLLPPCRSELTYSGVVTSTDPEKAAKIAKHLKLSGIRHFKLKVTVDHPFEHVAAVRAALGEELSLRVDANGSFNSQQAIEFVEAVSKYKIDVFEQPIPRGDTEEFKGIRTHSKIPIMADESIVTIEDAKKLIDQGCCDFFNLRISKCGGLGKTLAIAKLAKESGVKIQLGCHVGETAILSAAGRSLAAHWEDYAFLEGSFGDLLLTEDISTTNIRFGFGGKARVLKGPGLGCSFDPQIIEKYSSETFNSENF